MKVRKGDVPTPNGERVPELHGDGFGRGACESSVHGEYRLYLASARNREGCQS